MLSATSRAGRTTSAITGSWVPSPLPMSTTTPPAGSAAAIVSTSRRQAGSASSSVPGPSHSPRFSQPGATARKQSDPMLSYTRAAGLRPCLKISPTWRTCWLVHPVVDRARAASCCVMVPMIISAHLDVGCADGDAPRGRRAIASVASNGCRRQPVTNWHDRASLRQAIPSQHPGQDRSSPCASVLSGMRCGKRCTSCGQPTATAIRPAQYRAWASSATSTTAKPPRCSLVSTNGPSLKIGEPLLGSTLHTTVDASRPPSLKTKTPACVISSISARAAVAFSRSSSSVCSGTHSSLNAIRYSAIGCSSAHGQPGRLPLTFSTNALGPIRHPATIVSIRSSVRARSVETQDHLDDRALPDPLRSLHRHLDRHQVAAIPGKERSGEFGVADSDQDRHLAPVDQAAGLLLQILAIFRRHGHEQVRRRPAPLDHLAGEVPLHPPIIGDAECRACTWLRSWPYAHRTMTNLHV